MNTTNFYNLPIHVKEQILQNYFDQYKIYNTWNLEIRKLINKQFKYPIFAIKVKSKNELNSFYYQFKRCVTDVKLEIIVGMEGRNYCDYLCIKF